MYDCADDLVAFHNSEVTLPQSERTNMRERRDANRKRLKKGLTEASEPLPEEHATQGGYAMKTMVQLPDGDHDIDDGAYFKKADLKGAQGADRTALDARHMVRDALDDGSFKRAPEALKNCVRVFYDAGYQVDVPVYRTVVEKDFLGNETTKYELASSDWKKSDARDVTSWFDEQNKKQSPDTTNGRQLRRVVRYTKYYTTSRSSWTGILGGFGITKLVTERFSPDSQREDRAFYDTLKSMRDRLNGSLVVNHPIQGNGDITNGDDDPRARKLRDKLDDALAILAPLHDADCTREKALKCWDKLFDTTFFSDRLGSSSSQSTASSAGVSKVLTAGLLMASANEATARSSVKKQGGDRYG